jgi:uroporphyrinogen decarboxylase
LGCKVPRYRGQRGPVTFAMSIYGVENMIFLCYDNPDLAARFSDVLCRAILERARVLDEEGGFTPETAPHGWGWCDDNCCMLNAEMYELFGYPILKRVFERYSPSPEDGRYQHSDSDMAHLLPLLGTLNMTGVNLGPTLSVTEIREHLPKARIDGQLAPYTLSRNEEVNIVAETLRDMELAREKKGINFTTAGSINNGSRLSGLRLIMHTIQEYKWGLE